MSALLWEVDERKPEARPVVSVGMLTFNHARYVLTAINSVLGQRADFDIELVIADDGSTDGTTEIVLDAQRRHPGVIRVLGSDENQGMHANFLRLLGSLRGSYTAFCDGDDYWTDPSKLARQVQLLTSNPGLGLVHSKVWVTSRWLGGWRRSRHPVGRGGGEGFDSLLGVNNVHACSALLRTDIIDDFLASPMGRKDYAVGDWPLFLFAASRSRIAWQDAPTAAYRRVPGSAMNSGPAKQLAQARSFVEMVEDFSSYCRPTEEVRKKAERRRLRYLARTAARAGDLDAARSAWNDLRALGPLGGRESAVALTLSRRWAAKGFGWARESRNRLRDWFAVAGGPRAE